MRLIIVIIILVSFNINAVGQVKILETDSLLFWQSSRKLKWEDFKGEVGDENYNNAGAIVKAGITIKHQYWNGDIPVFAVNSYMKKFDSWNKVSDSLSLVHEQGHFDIYEIYARKIRKAYDSLNKQKVTNIKVYESMYRKYMKESSEINSLYEESNFSKRVQEEWSERIIKELQELEDYEYILEE
ncbi:hypothetical protein [Aestuariibaculum suncheonense]|uniref:DUF922 domain-containing protein n=1 Tax=Aestuariibaculum suncheonense TaxID=1028745 RepID=A0A8J6Q6Q5_9FLAO|nr:hypothetical protein [Aestuariibaculum suncheonense]MBD0835688.1 hypothetical protein [Aestuariibaculum suncheonense]